MQAKLLITRSREFNVAILSLFDYLLWLNRPKIVLRSHRKRGFKQVIKQPGEIVDLQLDYGALERKIYAWYFSQRETLELTYQEVWLLFECCHAALFYMKEKTVREEYNYEYIQNLYETLNDNLNYYYERY